MVRETLANDITYIWTREGWAYLAVIIDLYSRRVIGWAIGNRMLQDLALRALDMATALRRPPPGWIVSHRGARYCAHEYQKRLRRHKLRPSMSGRGNCYDNSAVESFFKSLKAELIWRNTWQTRRDVEVDYINGSTTRAGAIPRSMENHPWPSKSSPPETSNTPATEPVQVHTGRQALEIEFPKGAQRSGRLTRNEPTSRTAAPGDSRSGGDAS